MNLLRILSRESLFKGAKVWYDRGRTKKPVGGVTDPADRLAQFHSQIRRSNPDNLCHCEERSDVAIFCGLAMTMLIESRLRLF